jgi:hypothetical protein
MSKYAFSNFEVVLLKKSSLDATFKSVGDVNNVYSFKRIIGNSGGCGLKKTANSFQIACSLIIIL